MASSLPGQHGPSLHTPLFDRFQSNRRADLRSLARDVADILGARQAHQGPGVLGWGLPGFIGASATSQKDQERIASAIAEAIERFEPRLTRVAVQPDARGGDFRFSVSASLIEESGRTVTLRILAPRRGGALGADVVVIGEHA